MSNRPPEGCTQWFTEPSGTITDWAGTDNYLQDSLDYRICVRQNMGYCCVEYQQCSDANSFSLSHVDATKAKQDETCTEDFAQIDGKWKMYIFDEKH